MYCSVTLRQQNYSVIYFQSQSVNCCKKILLFSIEFYSGVKCHFNLELPLECRFKFKRILLKFNIIKSFKFYQSLKSISQVMNDEKWMRKLNVLNNLYRCRLDKIFFQSYVSLLMSGEGWNKKIPCLFRDVPLK